MIYPEILDIESRRKKLKPKVSRVALCNEAKMSDETYRLWLRGEVSPTLGKVRELRIALEKFEKRKPPQE